MAMSVGSSNDGAMCDINTTPLIDVMLVLLIMFIITMPVMTHAVKLDMPRPRCAGLKGIRPTFEPCWRSGQPAGSWQSPG